MPLAVGENVTTNVVVALGARTIGNVGPEILKGPPEICADEIVRGRPPALRTATLSDADEPAATLPNPRFAGVASSACADRNFVTIVSTGVNIIDVTGWLDRERVVVWLYWW